MASRPIQASIVPSLRSAGASGPASRSGPARFACRAVSTSRRPLAALKLLAKKHRIPKEWDVPCLLVPDGTARTASPAENVQREAMHPADQFEAFAALVAEGRPIEDIAADLSVTPLVVQRRLKLANVSPRLMADYRADAVTLDQLMALAITDDHAAQESGLAMGVLSAGTLVAFIFQRIQVTTALASTRKQLIEEGLL